MQKKILFNGVEIAQPIEYKPNLATTSTEDSDRDQSLVMNNTPIGTVVSYSLRWEDLTAEEVSQILSQVLNKSSFSVHYFDIISGQWKTDEFYASNFSASAFSLKEGEEGYDELSFNIVGKNAR